MKGTWVSFCPITILTISSNMTTVTKEETVWESFSEDEPAPKPKSKLQASTTTAKSKKGAEKRGQGNIMSFFGKKS